MLYLYNADRDIYESLIIMSGSNYGTELPELWWTSQTRVKKVWINVLLGKVQRKYEAEKKAMHVAHNEMWNVSILNNVKRYSILNQVELIVSTLVPHLTQTVQAVKRRLFRMHGIPSPANVSTPATSCRDFNHTHFHPDTTTDLECYRQPGPWNNVH